MNGEIAEVVHELNNVLTGILVSSGLLEQRLEADSPLRRYAAGIREGGENGVRLIRELQASSFSQRALRDNTGRKRGEAWDANHRDE